MMKIWMSIVAAGVVALSAPVLTQSSAAASTTAHGVIHATFVDGENQTIGAATLRQAPHGVVLSLDLTNAQPGAHALHIHAAGRCEAPSFESAGPHFNPSNKKHGFMNAAGPHVGDLPNVVVPDTRKLTAEFLVAGAKLSGPAGLLDADGAALVIHGARDDHASDPAGNAGNRIACAAFAAERR